MSALNVHVTHKDFRNGFEGHRQVSITVGAYTQYVTFDGVNERSVDCNRCGEQLLVRRVDEATWQSRLAKRRREGRSRLVKGFVSVSIAPPMCVSPSLWGDAFIPLAIAGGIVALFGLGCLLMAAADLIGKPDRFVIAGQGHATKTSPEGVRTIHYVKTAR